MKDGILNILTPILIVLNFQVLLELSHLIDYHWEIYSTNLIYQWSQWKLNIFTAMLIALSFQIRLEWIHSVVGIGGFYWKI